MFIIESRKQNNTQRIELRITINGKQQSLDFYNVSELKKLIAGAKPDQDNPSQCHFRGQRKQFQLGDVYVGPDSTLQFNFRKRVEYENFMIKSQGRIYFNQLKCSKLSVKSQSIRFFKQNICKQGLQFNYYENAQQAKILRNNGAVDSNRGSMKICKDGKLQLKRLKVSNGTEIYVSQNSHLKFTQNKSIFKAQNSKINIDFQGKFYCSNIFSMTANTIKNKGYISTRNQQKGTVRIQCKQFDNFGQLKLPSLTIMGTQMKNHSQATIQVRNGKILLQKQFQNKGQIAIPCINIGFVDGIGDKAKIQNKGTIITKQFLTQAEYCVNSGTICCDSFSVTGKNEKNLLKNTGTIITQKLQITDMIFLNSQNARIISNGDLQVFIQGWINKGQIQNKDKTYACVKGHISNKGTLQFNQAILRANTLNNQNKLSAHKNMTISASDLFINQKGANISTQKINIFTNKLKNLGSIIVQQLNIDSNMVDNGKQGIMQANKANINGKYIYNSGEQTFLNANINAQKLHNQNNFFANTINFTGGNIKNEKKMQINGGNISTKMNYVDTQQAQGIFRNVKMSTANDDMFYTEGKLKMQGVDVSQSFKYFYNTKQVDFDKVQLVVEGIKVKDLYMKDTHITFKTFKQQQNGKIYSKGGYNGLHEGQRQKYQQNKQNQFVIDIKTKQLYQQLSVICQDQTQIVIGTTNPFMNGWNLLQHPIGVGEFSKKLICDNFQIPGNVYENNLKDMKKNKYKKILGKNANLYEKYFGTQVPNTGQTQLTIQTRHLLFGGKLKYNGKQLNIKTNEMKMCLGMIQVPDGILKVDVQQNLLLTHAYMQAKGLQIHSGNQITLQASKLLSKSSNLLLDALKIVIKPTVRKFHTQSTSANGKVRWVNDWQQATVSELKAEGSIIIRADQYITMIAPNIKAKKNLIISSPNTHIQGMFLYKNCTTYVKKKKMMGGSKTNIYGSRGDIPLPAFLQAQEIIFTGNAKVNANFKAKQIIDLTEQGLHLFYVVGYSGSFQNRQFSNFFTQGCEGYMHTRQKFLKANLSQVQKIIRSQNLKGQMIFDTVEWGKTKPIIIVRQQCAQQLGKFKQLKHVPKSWFESWEHETIGPGLMMIIQVVAAYVGANCLGPALISVAGATSMPIACMAIKSASAAICGKFFTTLAVTGKLDTALSAVFSIDTVICAAANFGLDFAFNSLAKPLGISLSSKDFVHILKRQFLKSTLGLGMSVLRGQKLQSALLGSVKGMIGSIIAQVSGNAIGESYAKGNINYFIHKALHAAVGAIQGLVTGGNINSMISGAVGGVVAQIVIDALVSDDDIVRARKTSDNAQQQFAIQKLVAKIFGGVAGGLCGNFEVAMQVASNAINYNFQATLQKKLQILEELDQIQGQGKPYLEILTEQRFKQIQQMLMDDGRQVAVADVAYDADQKTVGKDQNPIAFLAAQKASFQQYKKRFPHLKMNSYVIVDNLGADYHTQRDFFVLKSFQQQRIYIGVSGTRFGGINYKRDGLNDAHIQVTGKAIPQRQARTQAFIRGIAKMNPNFQIKISGHSLGGNLSQHALLNLQKQYKNLWVTSINAFHGFNKPVPKQIIQNERIKRLRTKNQWPSNHGMNKFAGILEAGKANLQKYDNNFVNRMHIVNKKYNQDMKKQQNIKIIANQIGKQNMN